MLNNSTIKISIKGTQITKNAKTISDPNKVKDIVDKYAIISFPGTPASYY
jgi:hypothetical protein